jgi:HTH-type transcriptional regulator/antitoxin HigA
MEKMNTLVPIAADAGGLNPARYGRLLAKVAPKAIETERENTAALTIVEELMAKGDDGRTREEDVLLGLLIDLIGNYEHRAHEPFPEGSPVDVLRMLMESHKLRRADLEPIFGTRARISEVLSGARGISKVQAKKLSERFGVSAVAFLA